MKVAIEVKNRDEANVVKAAWEDETVRAFVLVLGVLKQLPSDRARVRVLNFVKDRMEEDEAEVSS